MIVLSGKLFPPGSVVAGQGMAQPVACQVVRKTVSQRRQKSVVEGGGWNCSDSRLCHIQEAGEIVWSPRLHARTDRRRAHAAERLPQHDGPCRAAIDIQIAGADAPFPQLDLPLVEAVDRAGEPVAGGVDQRDRLGEPLEAHHAENGAKKFGTVGGAPRGHAIFHAG